MSAINRNSLASKSATTEVLFNKYDTVQYPPTPKKESPTVGAWEMMALLCELCNLALGSKAYYKKTKTRHSMVYKGLLLVTLTSTLI